MWNLIRQIEIVIMLAFLLSIGMATFSIATNIPFNDTTSKILSVFYSNKENDINVY